MCFLVFARATDRASGGRFASPSRLQSEWRSPSTSRRHSESYLIKNQARVRGPKGVSGDQKCLARLSGAAAQYRDALRGGSRFGHQWADFAVHSITSLRVGSGGIRERFLVRRSGKTAQAERQLADLGGDRDHLALLRRHLECRGMRDERFARLAVEL